MISSLLEKAKAIDLGVAIDGKTSLTSDKPYVEYIGAIYEFSLKLGGSLVILMMIYAGYIYITSKGDTTKLNQAKDIFLGTLLGFVLLYFIGIILEFIGLPRQGV